MLRSVISDEPEESNPPSVFNSIDASFQMRLKELEEKQEVNIQFCTCTLYLDTLTMTMAITMIMVVCSRFGSHVRFILITFLFLFSALYCYFSRLAQFFLVARKILHLFYSWFSEFHDKIWDEMTRALRIASSENFKYNLQQITKFTNHI